MVTICVCVCIGFRVTGPRNEMRKNGSVKRMLGYSMTFFYMNVTQYEWKVLKQLCIFTTIFFRWIFSTNIVLTLKLYL